jgi:hypothetical protein
MAILNIETSHSRHAVKHPLCRRYSPKVLRKLGAVDRQHYAVISV